METTSCSSNAGSREVSLLWFRRGIKSTTQKQTCSGSLYVLSLPRAKRIPWRFASLPDRASRFQSLHPELAGVRTPGGEFIRSKSAGAGGQNSCTSSLLLSRGERCALSATAAGSVQGLRGKERGAFKAKGEEPPPGGVSVSATASAPRSPSPLPPSLALGARGCAALSGSRGLPARPSTAAPPRGPPLPLSPTLPPAKGKDFPWVGSALGCLPRSIFP